MKRIIIHWSAGTYKPNQTDLLHYHFLIDNEGKTHNGVYAVSDNENCLDGVYAAHTGGGNTGSIGVALCGMYGYKNRQNVGKYPLTQKQCEACFKLCADLCKKYNIKPADVQTHYGFGKRNPKTSSAGKIDINYLPYAAYLLPDDIETFIRNKIRWYMDKI